MNAFYTFRCAQSLEMIRLYSYKNVNWNETWLCVVIIGCRKKLLWKNQGRSCWIQRENNDVNVYATSKSTVSVQKKDISVQQICFEFSWRINVQCIISAGVCNFLSSLAMLTTTYKHKQNLRWTLPVLRVDDRKR